LALKTAPQAYSMVGVIPHNGADAFFTAVLAMIGIVARE
jgi:hypothetical protein